MTRSARKSWNADGDLTQPTASSLSLRRFYITALLVAMVIALVWIIIPGFRSRPETVILVGQNTSYDGQVLRQIPYLRPDLKLVESVNAILRPEKPSDPPKKLAKGCIPIIYLKGHGGVVKDDQPALLTRDGEPYSEGWNNLESTISELSEHESPIKLLILDWNHSVSNPYPDRRYELNQFATQVRQLVKSRADTQTVVLLSGEDGQPSAFNPATEHSTFAKAVADGLTNSDVDGNGVQIGEFFNYVSERVKQASVMPSQETKAVVIQTPILVRGGDQGIDDTLLAQVLIHEIPELEPEEDDNPREGEAKEGTEESAEDQVDELADNAAPQPPPQPVDELQARVQRLYGSRLPVSAENSADSSKTALIRWPEAWRVPAQSRALAKRWLRLRYRDLFRASAGEDDERQIGRSLDTLLAEKPFGYDTSQLSSLDESDANSWFFVWHTHLHSLSDLPMYVQWYEDTMRTPWSQNLAAESELKQLIRHLNGLGRELERQSLRDCLELSTDVAATRDQLDDLVKQSLESPHVLLVEAALRARFHFLTSTERQKAASRLAETPTSTKATTDSKQSGAPSDILTLRQREIARRKVLEVRRQVLGLCSSNVGSTSPADIRSAEEALLEQVGKTSNSSTDSAFLAFRVWSLVDTGDANEKPAPLPCFVQVAVREQTKGRRITAKDAAGVTIDGQIQLSHKQKERITFQFDGIDDGRHQVRLQLINEGKTAPKDWAEIAVSGQDPGSEDIFIDVKDNRAELKVELTAKSVMRKSTLCDLQVQIDSGGSLIAEVEVAFPLTNTVSLQVKSLTPLPRGVRYSKHSLKTYWSWPTAYEFSLKNETGVARAVRVVIYQAPEVRGFPDGWLYTEDPVDRQTAPDPPNISVDERGLTAVAWSSSIELAKDEEKPIPFLIDPPSGAETASSDISRGLLVRVFDGEMQPKEGGGFKFVEKDPFPDQWVEFRTISPERVFTCEADWDEDQQSIVVDFEPRQLDKIPPGARKQPLEAAIESQFGEAQAWTEEKNWVRGGDRLPLSHDGPGRITVDLAGYPRAFQFLKTEANRVERVRPSQFNSIRISAIGFDDPTTEPRFKGVSDGFKIVPGKADEWTPTIKEPFCGPKVGRFFWAELAVDLPNDNHSISVKSQGRGPRPVYGSRKFTRRTKSVSDRGRFEIETTTANHRLKVAAPATGIQEFTATVNPRINGLRVATFRLSRDKTPPRLTFADPIINAARGRNFDVSVLYEARVGDAPIETIQLGIDRNDNGSLEKDELVGEPVQWPGIKRAEPNESVPTSFQISCPAPETGDFQELRILAKDAAGQTVTSQDSCNVSIK